MRSRMIPLAIDARRQKYSNEKSFQYKGEYIGNGIWNEETRAEIEQWASRTVEVLASGTPLAAAVEKPLGLKSSFTPRTGTAWIRESELAGNPAFFKVFQASSGEVVGPLPEEGFGWHLMRVVESQPARSYSEMRPQWLQMWLAEPASDEELLAVERLIRSRFPVQIKGFDSR